MNIITMTSKINRTLALGVTVLAFAGVVFTSMPAKAHAFDILDPFCLWSGCGHSSSAPSTNTSYYSNTNSNVNSPGSSVSNTTNNNPITNNNPVNTNNVGGGTTPIVIATNPNPVYTYNYGTYPTNTYYGGNPTYYGGSQSQLGGSCYPSTSSTNVGNTVVWNASAYGGNGTYNYSWSGSDGLYGYGTSVSYSYNTSGSKVANVTITSGGQSIAIPCSQSVIVNGYNNNYNNNYNYNYNNGYNYNNSNNYSTLSVSCDVNTTSAPVGTNVVWTSNVSGGNGSYTYNWSGTDGIYGSGSTISASYNSPGAKYATLTVYSNGQSITNACNRSVFIGQQYNYNNNNNNNNSNTIIAACAADAVTTRIGNLVTWSVEATGASGNYSYEWSGDGGLSGSSNSVSTSYSTNGLKNASVIVTSSDGRSTTKSCGNVNVRSATVSTNTNGGNGTDSTNSNTNLTGAALFSLGNIPWGWVAFLIILVLFGTVLYLLFNQHKI